MLSFLRIILAGLLGLLVWAGMLMYMVFGVLLGNLLDPESYVESLDQADAYNRIYSEVLVDPALRDDMRDWFGDIELEQGEVAALFSRIAPPEYLRSQTVGVIRGSLGYLNGDLEDLEVYVDLSQPLANTREALLDQIYDRIDGLPATDLAADPCSPDGAGPAQERFRALAEKLAAGSMPESLPSLESIAPDCRELMFDRNVERALASRTLSAETRSALKGDLEEIREAFVAGDTHGFFKTLARSAVGPSLDQAIQEIRDHTDSQGRVDLIAQAAELEPELPELEEFTGPSGVLTEAEVRRELSRIRGFLGWLQFLGSGGAILLVVGGTALMALVFIFDPGRMMRWSGLNLLVGGGVNLALGKLLASQVPNWLQGEVVSSVGSRPDFPVSIADLSVDLVMFYSQTLVGGISGLSLVVVIVGAVVFAASFFWSMVRTKLLGE